MKSVQVRTRGMRGGGGSEIGDFTAYVLYGCPLMCSGCFRFFAKSYKTHHQLICPSSGTNVMLPVVSIEKCTAIDKYCDEFKELLSKLLLDEIGDYVKTDEIILMIGARSFGAMKRKKDKIVEGKRTVRSRMRLLTRIYVFVNFIMTKLK